MLPNVIFSDSFILPTYLLWLSLIYTLGVFWFYTRAKKYNLNPSHALDFYLLIMLSGLFGARLLHILYENPSYYWKYPLHSLYVWQGGFVFYGGAIAAFVSCLWLARKRGLNFWQWTDIYAPVIAIGYGLGRIACFFNGCCYGSFCRWPWAIVFPSHEVQGIPLLPRHPTQLYASLWEISLGLLLLKLPVGRKPYGFIFLIWLLGHSLGRIVMEAFRADPRGASLWGLSLAIWISLLFLFLALAGLWRLWHRK